MKIKFYILLKIPLSKFDYERFNIENLEKRFDLKILDCSEVFEFNSSRDDDFKVHCSIVKIRKIKDLNLILQPKGGYVLDLVGQFHPKAVLLLNCLHDNQPLNFLPGEYEVKISMPYLGLKMGSYIMDIYYDEHHHPHQCMMFLCQ